MRRPRAMRSTLILAAALSALAAPALAHSPYLLPNTFDASGRDHVTVEASFTEDMFYPDIVMKSDAWSVTSPSGQTAPLTAAYFKDLAILEVPAAAPGTYRISSGPRIGRTAKAAQVKGQWTFFEEGKTPPPGATLVDMQSITTAEVYVSKASPSAAAVAPLGKGLEIHPITHPSSITAGKDAVFELLVDGKPLPGQSVDIERGGHRYDDQAFKAAPVTDAAGRFTVRPDRPGVFHAQSRYRVGPAAPGGPWRSLTYALTFEAAE